jgi:hypothetical protein
MPVAEYEGKEAWHQAVMWHGVSMLPRLRRLSDEERLIVMRAAGEHNCSEPLWLFAGKRRFSIPLWSDKPLSGAEVAALMVFGLWVQCGEDEGMAGQLVGDWPEIRTAVFLVGLEEKEALR